MNKLQEGPPPLATTEDWKPVWDFIAIWGGSWTWHDINNLAKPNDDIQWIAEGMTAGALVWTTNGSYDRKSAADLLGVGCKTSIKGCNELLLCITVKLVHKIMRVFYSHCFAFRNACDT
jgi:hypothetical protein